MGSIHQFTMRRRNLPHWQDPGYVYFVTFRTIQNINLSPSARHIISRCFSFFDSKRYRLYSFVIMPNHVHAVLQPMKDEKGKFHSLSGILHSIKSYSANEINKIMGRKGALWQPEAYDRILRDEEEIFQKINYMMNNPIKAGLAKCPNEYKWFFISPVDPGLDEVLRE